MIYYENIKLLTERYKGGKMKKLIRVFSITVLSIGLSLGSITVLRADSETIHYDVTTISQDYSELDEYIVIKDNQYILELPSNITLSSNLKEKINTTLQESNNTIVELGLIINAETKEATHYTMDSNGLTRAYGVSSISISWNSIILKVSAKMLRSIASVITGIAVGAAVGFVAAKNCTFLVCAIYCWIRCRFAFGKTLSKYN